RKQRANRVLTRASHRRKTDNLEDNVGWPISCRPNEVKFVCTLIELNWDVGILRCALQKPACAGDLGDGGKSVFRHTLSSISLANSTTVKHVGSCPVLRPYSRLAEGPHFRRSGHRTRPALAHL